MTDPTTEGLSDLDAVVAEVVDDFRTRRDRGDTPDPEEYAARYPEAAAVIRRVLATLTLVPPGAEVGWGRLGDFRLLREVGRGGMGVVYEAEQESLGRRVALKVLPFAATADPRHLDRFRHEARAAALLHHPHIVPVYAVGSDRGVHYYAMQFIDGRTVADLIAEAYRPGGPAAPPEQTVVYTPAAGTAPIAAASTAPGIRPRDFYRTAARVCAEAAEGLEYAHGMGVVHRDVKPGNLLVDPAGQAWVADFGLAKLGTGPGVTGTGDLLGTLRYMAPEQAEAKHNLVDHRADVYALGATLYELLTGRPAVPGEDRREVLRRVLEADPVPPQTVDRRVPADLATVCLKCLEKDPARRYQSAADLAADLRRYLADQPVVATRPTLVHRASKWVRRNRQAAAAAAVGFSLVAVTLAASLGWVTRDAAARRERAEQLVGEAHREATRLCGLMRWPEALAEVRRADGLLAGGDTPEPLAAQVRRLRSGLELVARLEDARLTATANVRGERYDYEAADAAYAVAFRQAGVDPNQLVGQVPTEVGPGVVAALLEWRAVRHHMLKLKNLHPDRFLPMAQTLDPDEWRCRFRDAFEWMNAPAILALADELQRGGLPPQSIHQLWVAVRAFQPERARAILELGQQWHPEDFWINSYLGIDLCGREPRRPAEGVRFLTAAVALRPDSPGTWNNLGIALCDSGDQARGILAYREAIRLKPDYSSPYHNLGNALAKTGDKEAALRSFREAVRIDPGSFTHINIGVQLMESGDLDGAMEALREAVRIRPDDPIVHVNLGDVLKSRDLPAAVAALRTAIRLAPDLPISHVSLADALSRQGKLDEAAAALKQAERLKADPQLLAIVHNQLGHCHFQKGDFVKAAVTSREAIRHNPVLIVAHLNLAKSLGSAGDIDGAITACEEAVRVSPGNPDAWQTLGTSRGLKKDYPGALAAYREAIRLAPASADLRHRYGINSEASGDLVGAVAAYREAVRLDPGHSRAHYNLAAVLARQGDLAGAVDAYREAIRAAPEYAEAHCNLGDCLTRMGRFREGLEARRRGHELGSRNPKWPYPSAAWVREAEQLVAADARLPGVLSGVERPRDQGDLLILANAAMLTHRPAAAARLYTDALASPGLSIRLHGFRYNAACAAAHAGCGRDDGAGLPEADRAKLRGQALRWLTAELAGWAKQGGPNRSQVLRHWQTDPDLAGVRGEPALVMLPEVERDGWRKLWADVAAVLTQTQPETLPAPRRDKPAR